MTPAAYCRNKTKLSGSSFYYPLLFLPTPAKEAMFALYAFCREVDDSVDNSWDTQNAETTLAKWRQELNETFAGRPTHPITLEIHKAKERFKLPSEPFFEIMAGMEMDLAKNRYQTLPELEIYCHKVAVAVGQIAVRIFGLHTPLADRFALHLGLALQLTNILRDVSEDARRGRIYLPMNLLKEALVSEEEILDNRWSTALGKVMEELANEAEHHFLMASALSNMNRAKLFPAIVMSKIYQSYLSTMRARGFDTFTQPVTLPLSRKIWIVLTTWVREKHRVAQINAS